MSVAIVHSRALVGADAPGVTVEVHVKEAPAPSPASTYYGNAV